MLPEINLSFQSRERMFQKFIEEFYLPMLVRIAKILESSDIVLDDKFLYSY